MQLGPLLAPDKGKRTASRDLLASSLQRSCHMLTLGLLSKAVTPSSPVLVPGQDWVPGLCCLDKEAALKA